MFVFFLLTTPAFQSINFQLFVERPFYLFTIRLTAIFKPQKPISLAIQLSNKIHTMWVIIIKQIFRHKKNSENVILTDFFLLLKRNVQRCRVAAFVLTFNSFFASNCNRIARLWDRVAWNSNLRLDQAPGNQSIRRISPATTDSNKITFLTFAEVWCQTHHPAYYSVVRVRPANNLTTIKTTSDWQHLGAIRSSLKSLSPCLTALWRAVRTGLLVVLCTLKGPSLSCNLLGFFGKNVCRLR